jgi:chromate transporter
MNTASGTRETSLGETWRDFLRIGLLSFGGPAAQIALMHRVLVEEKHYIDEQRFLTGLNFCMLLPGPEAMQLVTYVGWRLHGVLGGLVAGLLFILPGAIVMLVLALGYAAFGRIPIAEALFLGVKAAVLAIILQALMRITKRALNSPRDWMMAAAAFLAMFVFAVPFPVLVLAAALIGFAAWTAPDRAYDRPHERLSLSALARTIAIWSTIWLLPLLLLTLTVGRDHVLAQLAWLHAKLAVVTFGGAYAVLTYLAHEAVQTHRWLQPGEMLDALGLAETAPGPIILVTEFVGTLAAWRDGGGASVAMGIAGALVVLWATFAPCFLWIFAGAPFVEQIDRIARLRSALAAITAAVVGVILNLALWFAMHSLFARTAWLTIGPVRMELPILASIRLDAVALATLAFGLLFLARQSVVVTLAITAAAGLAVSYAAAP